jgi:hypothetical protein
MKRLLLILILTFSFQTLSKADDIRDFQIEGISIEDSLLDYVNIEYINNDKAYLGNNNKYYTILLEQDYQTFDAIQLTIQDKDKNYIIKSLTGKIFYNNNDISECYKLLDNISLELSTILKDIIASKDATGRIAHVADKTGNSTTEGIFFSLDKGDSVYVYCTDWSDKMNYTDNLKVQIRTKMYSDWLRDEAYN